MRFTICVFVLVRPLPGDDETEYRSVHTHTYLLLLTFYSCAAHSYPVSYTLYKCIIIIIFNLSHHHHSSLFLHHASYTVAVTNVNIYLLDAGSGASATSPDTTDLDADALLVSGVVTTLMLIHNLTYNFEARTDAITPQAEFNWYRYSNGETKELLDNRPPGSSEIICPPTTDSDTYQLVTVDFDVYDGRRIRVFADNPHADAAQMNDVLLDVRGMLFTYVTQSRETS